MMTFFDPVLGVAFSYPSPWMEVPYDKVAGTFVLPTLGVAWADPAAGAAGGDLAAYMMMAAYEEPGQTAVAARPALDEWESMTLPQASGSMTALDAVAEFSTNGIPGAARTYRVLQQEHISVMRVAFLSHDDSMYVFVLSAAEAFWDTYLPIFDAVLQSFVIPM
ncbi:MAG: hypothetical protein JW990_01755 [Thermoleophilia bacterium]|nr:hypothetical protein [Thermoleophilia bacterium]